MGADERSVLLDVEGLGADERRRLWNQLPAIIDKEDTGALLLGLTPGASAPDLKHLMVQAVKALPPSEQASATAEALKALPKDKQEEVLQTAIGKPGAKTRDTLWFIVIGAFAVVVVGSFVVLAVGVFLKPAEGGVNGELILAMFTSVVGFLAGLFTPSPAQR